MVIGRSNRRCKAAGVKSLYLERHVRIFDAMSERADPDTAAWGVTAITDLSTLIRDPVD
jgi:hypothetical protein